MSPASLLLAIAGFAALAGAMRRHAKQIGLPAVSPRVLRFAGSVLLAASFIALLEQMNWRMAAVTWVGQAGLAAAVCVALLSLKPRVGQGGKAQPSRTDSLTSSVNGIAHTDDRGLTQ